MISCLDQYTLTLKLRYFVQLIELKIICLHWGFFLKYWNILVYPILPTVFFVIFKWTRIGCRNWSWHGFDFYFYLVFWMRRDSNPQPFDSELSLLTLDQTDTPFTEIFLIDQEITHNLVSNTVFHSAHWKSMCRLI